jgi:hypothetical protein
VGVFDGTQWNGVGTGLGVNGTVRDSVAWNGNTAVLGSFNEAGAHLVVGVALFDGTDWSCTGSFTGAVDGLATYQGDLVAVGNFTSVDGIPTPAPAARFDGTEWHALGSGALANAVAAEVYEDQLYALADFGLWRLDGTQWNQVGQNIYGSPYALHAHGGRLYVGGLYGFGQGNIFEWDGSSLTVLGGGTNATVRALDSFGGDLIVGGLFSSAGGVSANILARWDGSNWSGIGSLTGTEVLALEVLRGELYVGGNLFVPGLGANKYIARLAGSSFEALGSGMLGEPLTLTGDESRGVLHVGGIFGTAGGAIAWNFSTWDTGQIGGAAAVFRNGTSVNATCYSSNLPVLGKNWDGTIVHSGHPGATLTGLVLFAGGATGPIIAGGELLVNLGSGKLLQSLIAVSGVSNVHTFAVPPDASLAGRTFTAQGVILGGGYELCNAYDLTLGF